MKDTMQALAAMPAVKDAQGLRQTVKLVRKAMTSMPSWKGTNVM